MTSGSQAASRPPTAGGVAAKKAPRGRGKGVSVASKKPSEAATHRRIATMLRDLKRDNDALLDQVSSLLQSLS